MQTKLTVRVETDRPDEQPRQTASSETPILSEMTGSLTTETPLDDYHAYLENKYGQP